MSQALTVSAQYSMALVEAYLSCQSPLRHCGLIGGVEPGHELRPAGLQSEGVFDLVGEFVNEGVVAVAGDLGRA